jgi:hypothetical protein
MLYQRGRSEEAESNQIWSGYPIQDFSKYSGTMTHVIRSCVTIVFVVFLTNVFQNFMFLKTGMMKKVNLMKNAVD